MALSDMRSRIADDINTTDYNSQIVTAINRAIKHYSGEGFWFTETEDTFPTIINQQAYGAADSIPTDLGEIVYVEYSDSSSDYELAPRTKAWLERHYPDPTTGRPCYYVYWGNEFHLYPTPNEVNTVRVFYRKTYADLSADGDTNDWLEYAEDLIEARARKWINARLLMDYDAARVAGIEEDEALTALRRQHSDKKPVEITPSRY